MSDEYELAQIAAHLEVNAEKWFDWPEEKRTEYSQKLNELSIVDILKKKTVHRGSHNERVEGVF